MRLTMFESVFIREFPIAAMLHQSLKSRFM